MVNAIEEISFYTNISPSFIFRCIPEKNNYFDFYKKIKLKKKDGSKRIIYVPCPELKTIQHFIVERYLNNLPISNSAFAYKKGISVFNNATQHLHNKHFLFIDLHDFFNSIDFDIMKSKIIKTNILSKFSEKDVFAILSLCSHEKKFVQGCVSSPILSNFYMYDFDLSVKKLVSKLKDGVYTRYSDDITISSSEVIPQELLGRIKEMLFDIKLLINERKTRYCSYLEKIKVTGLRINNKNYVSLDTAYKKKIKTEIYHIFNKEKTSPIEIRKILGRLNYLKMIDVNYYNKINNKYSSKGISTVDRLKKLLKGAS